MDEQSKSIMPPNFFKVGEGGGGGGSGEGEGAWMGAEGSKIK